MRRSKHNHRLASFLLLGIGLLVLVPVSSNAQADSLAFGDTKRIGDGLKVELFFLPNGTSMLPMFDTMKPAGILYTKKIDVPARSWTTGFPGVNVRSESFGIVYTGSFKVKKPGHYIFRLLSDDGSKLYIDKKTVIDNDGIHAPGSRLGDVKLDGSKHSFRLEYFQGSQAQIALQLFVAMDNENEQPFPGYNFTLITPSQHKAWVSWLIYIGIGLFILLLLWIWLRRKRRIPAD